MRRRCLAFCIGIAIGLLCFGCQTVQLEPTLVVVSLATPEPTPVTLHLSTVREVALAEEAPQIIPTSTPAPTAAATATPAATAEVQAGVQSEGQPTATATPKVTAKATATPTPKPTASPTPAPKSTASATPTPKTTATPTPTPSPIAATAAPALTPPPTVAVVPPDDYEVPAGSQYSSEEVLLAARTAYFEARGKGEAAYRAVICVILNRVESSKYGGGVTSVKTEVYRQSQFSVVNRSDFTTTVPPDDIIGYANDVLNNNNRSIPAEVFFFRAEQTDKTWGTKVFYKTIGGNDFYYGG